MSGIEWLDEPPKSSGWDGAHRAASRRFAEELRRHPGKWAEYPWARTPDSARAIAFRINRGTATYPKGQFQATSRNGKAYVRYIGRQNGG